jgi:single-strand DNA-binding protein
MQGEKRMQNLALVILDGNLTRDPESRKTKNEKEVTSFAVALNHEWGAKEGNNAVSYINVECWGKLAENCARYLKKGSRVTVQGQLRQDRWKDDEGAAHSRVKVLANSVRFDYSPKKEAA